MRRILLILGCLGFALPLVVYMLIGANMRYSGDDYCYAANLTERGFLGSQTAAYMQNLYYYNGNRVSLNLFSALADLAGPYANAIWPALAILVWTCGVFLAFKMGLKLAGVELPVLALLAASEALIFFTLAQTQDIDQSLFWRTGMLTYLAPILVNIFLGVMLLRQAEVPRLGVLSLVLTAVLALIGAGFSETGGVVQAAWLGLTLLVLLGFYWRQVARRPVLRRMLVMVGVALLATLASLALLALSPTVTLLKPQLAQSQDLGEILRLCVLYTRRFLSTFKTAPVQNLLPAIVFASIAILLFHNQPRIQKVRLAHAVAILLGLVVLLLLLVLSSMVAYAYAQHAYPEPRAIVIPRFILTLVEAAAGLLAGIVILNFIRGGKLYSVVAILAGLALVASLAYPLWTGRVYWGELPRYQRWAEFWDRRDQALRQFQRQGEMDVHVMAIDHIIPRVGELTPQPDVGYNPCAAVYYHLHTISADLPGWDR